MDLQEFLINKDEIIAAFERAIFEAAVKHPESFKAWWKALLEGPQ